MGAPPRPAKWTLRSVISSVLLTPLLQHGGRQ
jgi:hypothetical protein